MGADSHQMLKENCGQPCWRCIKAWSWRGLHQSTFKQSTKVAPPQHYTLDTRSEGGYERRSGILHGDGAIKKNNINFGIVKLNLLDLRDCSSTSHIMQEEVISE
jgi:hypothetical protein